jgi:hypothetical protein
MRLSSGFAVIVPLLPLLFACGAGRSELEDSDSGSVAPPHPTPGPDGGQDAGCSDNVDVACIDPCGDPVPPTCVSGYWQCPDYGPGPVSCPIQIEDAGPDACSPYPPIACPQPVQCPGIWSQAVCDNGEWSCQYFGQCEEDVWVPTPFDAEPPPPPIDAQPAPPYFSCGDTACDPTATYCQIMTGGPIVDDGGPLPPPFACAPLPPTCAGEATCDCVSVPVSCDCVAQSGDVIVTCVNP